MTQWSTKLVETQRQGLVTTLGAIADYDTAIKLTPDDAITYDDRGVSKAELGKYSEAIADYNTAIRLNPDFTEAYHNRGVSKAYLGEYSEAIADFDTAIRLNPDAAIAYNNRGGPKESLGDYSGAIADYDTAIRLKPDLCKSLLQSWVGKGRTRTTRGGETGFAHRIETCNTGRSCGTGKRNQKGIENRRRRRRRKTLPIISKDRTTPRCWATGDEE